MDSGAPGQRDSDAGPAVTGDIPIELLGSVSAAAADAPRLRQVESEHAATLAADFRWSSPPPLESSLAQLEPNVRQLDPRIKAVLERCFDRLCGRDSHIDAKELGSALALESEYLAQRVLCALDGDRDGLIDRDDFLDSIHTLLFGSARDRLLFAFRIHDLDGDDALDRSELERMIGLGLSEDALEAPLTEAARLTDLLLSGVDLDQNGRICFAEFEAAVLKHASVLDHITQSGLIWMAADEREREQVQSGTRSLYRRALAGLQDRARSLARALENHALACALLVGWFVINGLLFEQAFHSYALRGTAVQLARGAGACLKLNCALLLLPVSRLALSWMRRAYWLRALPIDQALAFHRLLGYSVLGFSCLHGAGHLWHANPGLNENPLPLIAAMYDGPSGAVLLLILALICLGAAAPVRRRRFELFYLSHLLYLAFFPLVLAHAASFLAWFALPFLLFTIDRALRILKRTQTTQVVGACALPSQVTHLQLARPPGFAHRPTDYVFLRIPEIAPREWHPFTISSAPEHEHVSVHVRNLGNWTRALHQAISERRIERQPPLRVDLDGPYGAPCAHIFEARFAVLIGAGIGATPFASVLESVALRARAGLRPGALEKLHFFWINRDQRSFEWFRELLASIEQLDAGRLLDIRIHMTRGRHDAASAIVSLARELAHEKGGLDLVTGLKARTRMGPPNIREELRAIAAEHAPHRVAVFFCGPPGLARKVRAACLELDLDFRQEHF